jgi:hypothetical protein
LKKNFLKFVDLEGKPLSLLSQTSAIIWRKSHDYFVIIARIFLHHLTAVPDGVRDQTSYVEEGIGANIQWSIGEKNQERVMAEWIGRARRYR